MLQQTFSWTEDNFAEAREMWAEGRSQTQIADFFGISSSAVAGFISRNREAFPARKSPFNGVKRTKGKGTSWTEERIAEAAKLWSEGYKQDDIGDHFGVSKASIADMMRRYRAQFPKARDLTNRRARKQRKPRVASPVNLYEMFEQSSSGAYADGRRFIIPGQSHVAFADLKPHHCRFPVSAPDEANGPSMPCCGARRAQGSIYCTAHAKISRRLV